MSSQAPRRVFTKGWIVVGLATITYLFLLFPSLVAVIMGATQLCVFVQVVLPQLVPSLVSAGLSAFLMSFDEVVIAWFVTGPSTMTLPVKMYSSIQWEVSPVLAAVATILTFVSAFVCLGAYVLKQGNFRRESAGNEPPPAEAPADAAPRFTPAR